MFDPTVGRWLSIDPIGFEAEDANLYRYVGNEPTNATDPSGLVEKKPPKSTKHDAQLVDGFRLAGYTPPKKARGKPYSRSDFEKLINNDKISFLLEPRMIFD